MKRLAKRARSKRAKARFLADYQQLEPKHLLAGVAVGDFGDNFPVNGTSTGNWQYQWNAPITGMPGGGNAIDAPDADFTQLIQNETSAHTVDGEAATYYSGFPGGYLSFNRFSNGTRNFVSGHPGHASGAFGEDRFAIASYAITTSGYYTIADSELNLASSSSADGVEFRVFTNNEAALESGIVEAGKIGYFDTQLGYLAKGETIHVAFGANGNHSFDAFLADFTIFLHDDRAVLEGAFQSDFSTDPTVNTDHDEWSYLWNAPESWVANGDTGSDNSSPIGDESNYLPLSPTTSGYWTPDGNEDWTNDPDYHLNLANGSGHPGWGNASTEDRYAIAAYTVDRSGHYALRDAWIENANALSNGVEVYVHVDDGVRVDGTDIISSTTRQYFDADLGFLDEGSTIYVAYGANGAHGYDGFSTDFEVVRLIPRAAPDLSLQSTSFTSDQTIEVAEQSGTDLERITAAFNKAIDSNEPVKTVVFEAEKTYKLAKPANTPLGGYFFELVEMENVLVNGNGATLLIDDGDPLAFSRGMFSMLGGANIVFENLTIDYAKEVIDGTETKYQSIAFTQGEITNMGAYHIELTIDDPDGEFLVPDTQLGDNVYFNAGYAVDPDTPGRLKAGVEWAYYVRRDLPDKGITRSGNVITIDLGQTTGLVKGDKFVLERRSPFDGTVFSIAPNYNDVNAALPDNVTIDNVSVYSSPSVFVGSQLGQNVNVLNSNVVIRPGSTRLKSINADGIHIQSNRTGTWVENTKFEGLGDDIMNFYTNPNTIHNVSSDGKTFDIGHFYFNGLLGTNQRNFKIGEVLTFIDPTEGTRFAAARVTNVTAGITVTENGKNYGTVRVTLDQAIPASELVLTGDRLDQTIIYNSDVAQGFYVADTTLSNSRRYGNFVMASNVHLVDNLYDGVSDQAIAGHTEHGWPLGLFAEDVLVQGNEFVNTSFSRPYVEEGHQAGVVGFYMDKTGDQLVDQAVYEYSDIEIRDNVFYHWNKTAISVRNAKRVNIVGNVVMAGIHNDQRNNAIEVQFAEDVLLDRNAIVDFGDETLVNSANSNVVESNVTEVAAPTRVWLEFDNETTKDRTGNNRTVNNLGASHAQGRFDDGISFSGSESVSVNDGFNTPGTSITQRTVSVWFKQDETAPSGKQVIYEEGSANRGLNIYLDNGKLYIGRWDWRGQTFINVDFDRTETWTHVALVLDTSVFQLRGYLNGREFDSKSAGSVDQHSGWMSLGKASNTKFHDGNSQSGIPTGLHGSIDDFRIYDDVLTEAQIRALALKPTENDNTSSTNPNSPPNPNGI